MNQHHGPLRPRGHLFADAAPDQLLELLLVVREQDQGGDVELVCGANDGVPYRLSGVVAASLGGAGRGELVDDSDSQGVHRKSAIGDQRGKLSSDKGSGCLF